MSESPLDGILRREHFLRIPLTRLACISLLAAVMCSCQSTQRPAASPSSTTAAPAPTTSTAPAVRIQPLPVRPVQKSQPTASDKCPANPNALAAPTDVLISCDLARTTRFTLGPEELQLGLIHVNAPTALTSGFYEVTLTLDPSSATAWASFTAAHLHDHVAFIRDDLVLEAPIIEEQVTSGRIVLTTQTAQFAGQLAQLAGRPA